MSNTGKEIASALRTALADRIGGDRFELWFGNEVSLALREARLEVRVSDLFQLEQIRRRFLTDLEAIGLQVTGQPVAVDLGVRGPGESAEVQRPGVRVKASSVPAETVTDPQRSDVAVPSRNATSRRPETSPSSWSIRVLEGSERNGRDRASPPVTSGSPEPAGPEPDSSSCVVGSENRLAYASAEMILDHPGRTSPLFLYGPTGSGKTHLLERIRREARRRTGLRHVLSVSAEQFTTQFLDALQGSGLPSFRRKFRHVQLLLIDDLQFFLGKKTTLGELQNTVDCFLRDRRQLVLAADRSPAELTGMSHELRGRLSGGLVCHLVYPELETRRRLVKQWGDARGGLDADVAEMVATRFSGDIRQLSGALNRLHAHLQAHGGPMTLERAELALSDLLRSSQRVVRLTDIEGAVCEVFGIDRERLHSNRKEKLISQPRALAMWLARKHTRAGLSEICRYFGKRSHSTVVSAQQNVNRWVSSGTSVRLATGDCSVEDAIRRVESKLRSG